MAKLQALSLTNVSEPIQFVAMSSINDDVSDNVKITSDRLTLLTDLAQKMNLEFEIPDGGMYIFARTKNKINIAPEGPTRWRSAHALLEKRERIKNVT